MTLNNSTALVSILLVDDHEVFREGLRQLLQKQPDFRIVGEAATSQQAITLTHSLHPEVVILDIAMPGLSGLDAIHYLRAAQAHLRIILLSAHSDEHYAMRALHLGAVGYVLKEQSAAELCHAIRAARPAHPYISPIIADRVSRLLAEEDGMKAAPDPKSARRFLLTRREEQVLDFLVRGLTNRDIGQALGISPRTVEVYRTSLMHKLGLATRVELDRFIRQRRASGCPPGEEAEEGRN